MSSTELPTITDASAALAPPLGHGPFRVTIAGQELTIFVETRPALEQMVEDIRSAQKRVWLESYIFHHDSAGKAVAEVLKERARAGVDVRLLYDAIGSQATHSSFFAHLRRAGVQVHAYHSFWQALWRFSALRVLNRRDHRKLLVIDDRVAYFGGMNIVDPASAGVAEQAEHLPLSAGWRDVHVRMVGPRQAEIAASFERSWCRARGEPTPSRPPTPPFVLDAGEDESIHFFDSGLGERPSRAARLFMRLIAHARSTVALSMAYFLPLGRVLAELLRARRRGVLVRVVTPGESDVPLVQYASRHLYTRLLRRRFFIYERQNNMLHSKVMIVDDEWTVIGSANFDARSLWINLEFIAVIHSRKLARVLNDIVTYEMSHSKRITLRDFREESWWRRWRDRLAWALRWWL